MPQQLLEQPLRVQAGTSTRDPTRPGMVGFTLVYLDVYKTSRLKLETENCLPGDNFAPEMERLPPSD